MNAAIIGGHAAALCGAAGIAARWFLTAEEVREQDWDLLALASGAPYAPPKKTLHTRTLLLPSDGGAQTMRSIRAAQVVGYGFSPRGTAALSSTSLASIQRSLITLSGAIIEPQELPLPPELLRFGAENALLLTLLRLLCA